MSIEVEELQLGVDGDICALWAEGHVDLDAFAQACSAYLLDTYDEDMPRLGAARYVFAVWIPHPHEGETKEDAEQVEFKEVAPDHPGAFAATIAKVAE